jgi:dimethylaniline monooxygenase (N-oxide forming)
VSRLALALPLSLTAPLFELMVSMQCGSPFKWYVYPWQQHELRLLPSCFGRGFNPKMRITQSQPTVSSTLVHHVARGSITPRPNVKNISARSVEYTDGSTSVADVIIFATGYKISFPFLSPDITSKILPDPAANQISLYHNVFHPRLVARHSSTFQTEIL